MLRKSACGINRNVFCGDCAQPGGDAKARAIVMAGATARSILTKQFIGLHVRTLFVSANLRDPYLASQRKSGTIDLSLASPRCAADEKGGAMAEKTDVAYASAVELL